MKSENLTPLVTEAQKGNQKALNDLIESCYNDIYYFALKTVKKEDIAADVTQDACLKIIQSLDKLNDPDAFKSWALRITYNFCAMHFRATKDILVDENEDGETIFDTLADDSEDAQPDKAYENAEFKEMIRDMIESLPAEQASALMLYYYEKVSVKEIAEIHGVSEGTVKSRLNYGRKAVKEKVEDYEKRTGIRLHSITPLPLLIYWFFAQSSEKMPVAAALSLSSATATAIASASAAGVTAAKVGASALITKIIVTIAATAVVAGAVVGGVLISQNGDGEQTSASTTAEIEYTSPDDTSSLLGGDTISPDTTENETTATETTPPDTTTYDTTSPETTAPETTVPVPETTVPAPETTAPAPETTAPAPETTAPHVHSYGAWDVSKAPTCYAEGVEERSCACGVTETQAIPTVDHTVTDVIGKDATCTEAGLTDGKKCTMCGTFTVEQTEIPATGHSYTDGACSVCGTKVPPPSVGLEYTLNKDGESYCVSGIGACTDADLVIPSTYEGKPVTSIGDWAFRGCSSLTSIIIPDSITSIGYDAFDNCASLTYITSDANNPVYHSAGNCIIETATKTLVVGCSASVIPTDGSVTSIGHWAFAGRSSLTSITLPDGITIIGYAAFSDCSSLASINIPDSVTDIYDYAFDGCSSLTSLTIGNGVTIIGHWAFYNCSSLTSVNIPDSVTDIYDYAFADCTSLTSINYGGTMAEWEALEKGGAWDENTPAYTVHCSDGDIAKG